MKRSVILPALIALVVVTGCGGYNFEFGGFSDQFSGSSLDSAKWTAYKGDPRLSGGWLILPGTAGNGADVQSIEAFSPNTLRVFCKATQWAVDTSVGFESWIDDNGTPRHCAVVFTNNHLGIINQFVADNPATPEKENEWYTSIDPPLERGRTYEIQISWWSTDVTLYIDKQARARYRAADHPGAKLIPNQLLKVRLNASNDFTDELSVDSVYVGFL